MNGKKTKPFKAHFKTLHFKKNDNLWMVMATSF
jgi:hypothetical protein